MKILRIACGLYIFGVSSLFGQTPKWTWATKAGGNRTEQNIQTETDKYGNTYTLFGSQSDVITIGAMSFPGNPPVGGDRSTIVFAKLDSSGGVKNILKSENNSHDFGKFYFDDYGYMYLLGGCIKTVNILGRTLVNNTQNLKLFIIKIDIKTFSSVWIRETKFILQRSDFNEFFYANLFIEYPDTINGISFSKKGCYLAKVDTSFNVVANKYLGGIDSATGFQNIEINCIAVNRNKKIVLGGAYSVNSNIDTASWKLPVIPSGSTASAGKEGFISIWDDSLNFKVGKSSRSKFWDNSIMSYPISEVLKCGVVGNGDFYIVGEYVADSVFFDSISILANYPIWEFAGQRNIFSTMISDEGVFSSGRSYSSLQDDYVYGLSIDSLYNLYIAGVTNGVANIGSLQTLDAFILKLDRNQKPVWAKPVDSGNGYFASIFNDNKGNVYASGAFGKKNSIPPITTIVLDSLSIPWTPSAAGVAQQVDLYTARLGKCNLSNPTLSGPNIQSICQGDSLMLSCSAFQKYQWSTDDSTQSITVKKAGSYHCYIYDSLGCYARSQTVVVKVKQIRYSTLNQSICPGQSFLGYDTAGIYIDTLVSSLGCDSIRTINLSIKPKRTFSQSIRLCKGETLLVGPKIYSTAGIYQDTLTAANGCDSLITSTLNYDIPNDTIQAISQSLVAASGQDSYQWLDCNQGFAPISGATNSTFVTTANGSYSVKVTKGNCSDTSECVLVTASGPLISKQPKLMIQPNPSSGKAMLIWEGAYDGAAFVIQTIEGKTIQTVYLDTDKKTVLPGLSPGVYFIRPVHSNIKAEKWMVE